MCLTTYQTDSVRAEKDITVYKIVKKCFTGYYAPFREDYRYELNKTLTSHMMHVKDNMTSYSFVEAGLHSLVNPDAAAVYANFGRREGFVVLKAIIPKGSYYYEGEFAGMRSIASNQLIILGKDFNHWTTIKKFLTFWKK